MNNIKYKLYHGDCIEVMDRLIEKGIKVDLTLTSPPYDDLRNYNDSLIWNFDIFKQVADRLYKITKDGGIIVWVIGDKTENGSESGSSFKQALYFKEIGFNLHDTMIYAKNNPMPNSNSKRYTQAFEYMFVLSKGKIKTFNPIMEKSKYGGQFDFGKSFTLNKNGEQIIKKRKKINEYKKTSNIFYYTVGSTVNKGIKHPAIFPEKLAEDNILTWSNEGDLILDCFMGSNTTGKMALLNNRNYIGIEKVKEYFEIAENRLKNIL